MRRQRPHCLEIRGILKEASAERRWLSGKRGKPFEEIKPLSVSFEDQWIVFFRDLADGKIVELLDERGIDITETGAETKIYQDCLLEDGTLGKKLACRLDIVAENSSECVIVEVLDFLRLDDAQRLAKLLPRLPELRPGRFKGKKLYGALACLKSMADAHILAEGFGFFLIKGPGDSAHIVNKPDFQPKAY